MKYLKVVYEDNYTGERTCIRYELESPVTRKSITKVYMEKVFKHSAKNNLKIYSYDPVETDEMITAFCKKEQKQVQVPLIYGFVPNKCKCGSDIIVNQFSLDIEN